MTERLEQLRKGNALQGGLQEAEALEALDGWDAAQAQLRLIATAECGHHWRLSEFINCPVCAMKEGVSLRIKDLEAERDAAIAERDLQRENTRAELAAAKRNITAVRENAAIEIGELQGQQKRTREELAASQAEVERLKIEVYDVKSACRLVMDSCQSHIDSVNEREAALQAEVERLRKELDLWSKTNDSVHRLYVKLLESQASEAALRKTLGHYADPKNWKCPRCGKKDAINCFMGVWTGPMSEDDPQGYDTAQAALALSPAEQPSGEQPPDDCPECNGQIVRVYPGTGFGEVEICRLCNGSGKSQEGR